MTTATRTYRMSYTDDQMRVVKYADATHVTTSVYDETGRLLDEWTDLLGSHA